ncbi:AroM family protein [Acidobacteriota bacterium]
MNLGMITIGQSPRTDIIPEIRDSLGFKVKIIEKGALDGLTFEEIKAYSPKSTDLPLITRLKNGTEVKVAKKHLISRIKNCVKDLERRKVGAIVFLCTGEFPEIESNIIFLRPHKIMLNMVKGILEEGKLGIIVPSTLHLPMAKKKWARDNLKIFPGAVSPYTGTEKKIIATASELKKCDVDLIILDCMGFNKQTKLLFKKIMQKPVLLPRAIIGRIVGEMIGL